MFRVYHERVGAQPKEYLVRRCCEVVRVTSQNPGARFFALLLLAWLCKSFSRQGVLQGPQGYMRIERGFGGPFQTL